jgi:diketogulonate reductase-like aldo/keto reductase
MNAPELTLHSGIKIPSIGFGTWNITPNEQAETAVTAALQAGYRCIDTAKIYGNEQGVGAAIKQSGIARNELFITTKLWNDDQGYDRTLRACDESLKKLGLDYLDLYLIHWPASSRRHDSWRALERLIDDGRIKAAGVSNYTVDHLEELISRSTMLPSVNQIEFHPFIYEQQHRLLEFCRKHNIQIEAYSPLSRISSEQHGQIDKLAARYKKSAQQVILRWCLQHNTIPLPRSTSIDHIKSNLEIFDFTLTKTDMALLDSLSDGERVTWDPAGMG